MDPVVVAFDGNAGNAGRFQRLQGLNGLGKSLGQNLPGVEKVSPDQYKINFFIQSIFNNAREAEEKILVTL